MVKQVMVGSVADVEAPAPSWKLTLRAEHKSPATIMSYGFATTQFSATSSSAKRLPVPPIATGGCLRRVAALRCVVMPPPALWPRPLELQRPTDLEPVPTPS